MKLRTKAAFRGIVISGPLFAYVLWALHRMGITLQTEGPDAAVTFFVLPLVASILFWLAAGPNILSEAEED